MLRTDWAAGESRRRRWLANRLAVVMAALALAGTLSAYGKTDAASHVPSNSSKFAGAFVNWGPNGREHTLQIWEEWLNLAPSSVVGVDFYAESTWEDFSRLSWVPGIWKKLNPARNVVWSVPLTVKGTALGDVADGMHDAEFEAAAKAISEAQPNAIIRLGWEMNLASMPWSAKGQEADYIKAFRRVVQIFRRHSNGFKYDWCPGWGSQDSPADLAYPGDDVVDYIGLDVYDFKYDGFRQRKMGQVLFESAVRSAMASGVCRPTREKHELPRVGRWQFRRQPLLHSADARLVREQRRQYRLCGLF